MLNRLLNRPKKPNLISEDLIRQNEVRRRVLITFVIMVGLAGAYFTLSSRADSNTGTVDIVTYDGSRQCGDPKRVPVKRYINKFFSTGDDYYYTHDGNFVNGSNGYAQEQASAWYAYDHQISGTVPLYRLWNNASNVQNHFYSSKSNEVTNVKAFGWVDDGNAGYIATSQVEGTVPLYRIHNDTTHADFLSTDMNEINILRYALGYKYFADDPANFIVGYVWTSDGRPCYGTPIFDGNEIGSVNVVTDGYDGIVCTPKEGTTDPGSGANHGHVHLSCPAAAGGGPKTFKFISAARSGWHISGNSPHKPGTNDTFTVSAGKTTTFSLIMDPGDPPADPTPPTSAPAPGGGGGDNDTIPNGTLRVTTYLDSIQPDNKIGGIQVSIDKGGSGRYCEKTYATTNSTKGNGYGEFTMTCPAGVKTSDNPTGSREFVIGPVGRDDYSLSGNSPHFVGEKIHILAGQTTDLTLVVKKAAGVEAPPPLVVTQPSKPVGGSGGSGSGTTTTPSGSGSSSSTNAPASANKNGSMQVTTYVYESDSEKSRIGNVEIHTQADNHTTGDTAHNCDNYNIRTDSSGSHTDDNSNYGKAHFNNCWTNSGKQNYKLSYVQIPAGYSFRSFRITAPSGAKFTDGTTVNVGNVDSMFPVNANQTTKLEVWLTKNDDSLKAFNNVKQVVTQNGVRFEPANDSKKAQKAADFFNALVSDKTPNASNLDPNGRGGALAPSAPINLAATESEDGTVSLTWGAPQKNPSKFPITYTIERAAKGSTTPPEAVSSEEEELSYDDDELEIEAPQSFVYFVTADVTDPDSELDDPPVYHSPAATVEIQVTPVSDDEGDDGADEPEDDSSDAEEPDTADDTTDQPDSTSPDTPADDTTDQPDATSPDNDVSLTLPDDSKDDNSDNDAGDAVACDISQTSSAGSDLLKDIGDRQGHIYTPSCADSEGDDVDEFEDDAQFDIEYDDEDYGDDGEDYDLYGYDGTDWEEIDEDSEDAGDNGTLGYSSVKKVKSNGKTKYTIKSKKLFAVALVKKKHVPVQVLPYASIAGAVGVIVFVRVILKRRLRAVYGPYQVPADMTVGPVPPAASMSTPPAAPEIPLEMDEEAFMVHPDKQREDKR